ATASGLHAPAESTTARAAPCFPHCGAACSAPAPHRTATTCAPSALAPPRASRLPRRGAPAACSTKTTIVVMERASEDLGLGAQRVDQRRDRGGALADDPARLARGRQRELHDLDLRRARRTRRL